MRFIRQCVIIVFGIYLHIFNKIEVIGKENIPKKGAYVLCSNHVHWIDPIVYVASTWRMIYVIGKEELCSTKLKSWVMRGLGVIPVNREKPGSNGGSLMEAINKLKNGHLLLIYPEGTRFGLKKRY